MKNIFILFALFCCLVSYSQPKIIEYNDKFKEFDYYAKPSTASDLTTFFKSRITKDLLNAVIPYGNNDFQRRIFLTFRMNNNRVVNLKVNSEYSELNKMFIKVFKNYDIEKLNIKDKSPLNIYVIQLISWANNKPILNCSQHVIIDKYPVYKGCKSVISYNKMKGCINKILENHIVNNISTVELSKANIIGELKLNPKFLINKDGSLSKIKVKAKTNDLANELNRVVALLPKPLSPPMRNGNPTSLFYKGSVNLFINALNETYVDAIIKNKETSLNLSNTNDLALHFKKYLSDEELQRIPFPKKAKNISISFSIDKKGRVIELKTSNHKNKISNDKLISIFKKFPLEKLKINSNDVLERYSYIILTKINNETIIECSNTAIIEKLPVYKGCEKSKAPSALGKCLSEKISAHVMREFDTNIRNKTELKGKIKLLCIFKIDTDGNIIDVKAKAPNPFLANEVEKVIKDLPKVVAPGFQNGKAVKVPYSLPIVFYIK